MRPAPIIRVANGTFFRHHPAAQTAHPNPPLFSDLSFELPSSSPAPLHWCIVGPSLSGKTTLLQALRGRLLCEPPTARSYPFLSSDAVPPRLRNPRQAIRYVGFDAEQGLGGAGAGTTGTTSSYLAARYESRREDTDFSLRDFLRGQTELNPASGADDGGGGIPEALVARVVADLRLDHLLDLPLTFLSNGQGRRARIARALLTRPEVLLLDEPFMGLDPPTVRGLSPLLKTLADKADPRLVLTARPQDPLPEWITHLVYLRGDCQVESMGPKDEVLDGLRKYVHGVTLGSIPEDDKLPVHALADIGKVLEHGENPPPPPSPSSRSSSHTQRPVDPAAEPLVEMDGCQVRYGDKIALGNWSHDHPPPLGPRDGLVWTVRRGERWAVLGPNGSGKTTIVSLLASDHPQAYSLPLKLFGRSRLPDPTSPARPLTFWDIQARIGHSSPEVHQHMPRAHTLRRVVESAWAPTFASPPRLDAPARAAVAAALRFFEPELRPHGAGPAWADDYTLRESSFSAQRVALFLRAVIRRPDVVVLDEAFGGMDDAVRDKCTRFLAQGDASSSSSSSPSVLSGLSPQQALICIAHVKEEVPDCVRDWLCLPEANTGKPARFGRLDGPLREDEARWRAIWDES